MVLIGIVRIGPCVTQGLILAFLLTACNRNTQHTLSSPSIQWQDGVATGLLIPRQLLTSFPEDSVEQLLQIHLMNDSLQLPVMGEYSQQADAITFQPLVPFTPGLSYEVRARGKVVASMAIPARSDEAPTVTAVYPSEDTLPENLLKMYIQFSRPMREDGPLQYISLLRNGKDTVDGVFLDLRPALWNKEGTLLTLWLDPGRIKRDLQPNRNLGTPLRRGETYTMFVGQHWPAKDGATLNGSFSKRFAVTSRDAELPKLSSWRIHPPTRETAEPLIIELGEALDYVLLTESLFIEDPRGSVVAGDFRTEKEEKVLHFVPNHSWQPGLYSVACEARLEDLAGNNLNRLFDQEIATQETAVQGETHRIDFTVD